MLKQKSAAESTKVMPQEAEKMIRNFSRNITKLETFFASLNPFTGKVANDLKTNLLEKIKNYQQQRSNAKNNNSGIHHLPAKFILAQYGNLKPHIEDAANLVADAAEIFGFTKEVNDKTGAITTNEMRHFNSLATEFLQKNGVTLNEESAESQEDIDIASENEDLIFHFEEELKANEQQQQQPPPLPLPQINKPQRRPVPPPQATQMFRNEFAKLLEQQESLEEQRAQLEDVFNETQPVFIDEDTNENEDAQKSHESIPQQAAKTDYQPSYADGFFIPIARASENEASSSTSSENSPNIQPTLSPNKNLGSVDSEDKNELQQNFAEMIARGKIKQEEHFQTEPNNERNLLLTTPQTKPRRASTSSATPTKTTVGFGENQTTTLRNDEPQRF